MKDFLQKLKKVVRIVLYRPAISPSDAGKPVRISCHVINVSKAFVLKHFDKQLHIFSQVVSPLP